MLSLPLALHSEYPIPNSQASYSECPIPNALLRTAGCPTPNALLCIAGCPTPNALLRIDAIRSPASCKSLTPVGAHWRCFIKKTVLKEFCYIIYRRAPVLEFLFNKIAEHLLWRTVNSCFVIMTIWLFFLIKFAIHWVEEINYWE